MPRLSEILLPKNSAFAFALTCALCFCLGCGSNQTPTAQPQPAPFDVSNGEGNLVGTPSTLVYPTATTSTQPGLDTYYQQTICPASLGTSYCATNTASLSTSDFGNFQLSANPIANNPLGIHQVDAVKIHYTAINADKSPVTVSGGIAIPELPASSLKGLILYFHGTTTQRSNVPSTFTAPTDLADATDGILLAAVWASQGYVVIMPDYIGLGDDSSHPHPYVVYPTVNAQSGLAMVKAARTLLASSYQVSATLPLFVTGYSEGGAYALHTGYLMQNNAAYAKQLNVNLAKVVPISGFFDLSQTGLAYLFDNISATNNQWYSLDPQTSSLSKPYLTAYLVLAFANYSGVSASDMLLAGFYQTSCAAQTTACSTLNDLYFINSQSTGYDRLVVAVVDTQAAGIGWASGPTNYSNAITPLLTPGYAQALMQKDTSNPLYQQVVAADTYLFTPQFPLTLVSLQQDSVVTRKNSDVAYAYFTQQKTTSPLQETLVPNSDFYVSGLLGTGEVDHTTEMPFLSVLALNQFNQTK